MNDQSTRGNLKAHGKRYLKGNYYENQTRKVLISKGYYVIKSASSKGAIDIVALGRHHTRVIQVKIRYLAIYQGRERILRAHPGTAQLHQGIVALENTRGPANDRRAHWPIPLTLGLV